MADKAPPRTFRRVDVLGRIVIPSSIRRQLNLLPGEPVDIELEGSKIVLSPVKTTCGLCGSDRDVKVLSTGARPICATCRALIGGWGVPDSEVSEPWRRVGRRLTGEAPGS